MRPRPVLGQPGGRLAGGGSRPPLRWGFQSGPHHWASVCPARHNKPRERSPFFLSCLVSSRLVSSLCSPPDRPSSVRLCALLPSSPAPTTFLQASRPAFLPGVPPERPFYTCSRCALPSPAPWQWARSPSSWPHPRCAGSRSISSASGARSSRVGRGSARASRSSAHVKVRVLDQPAGRSADRHAAPVQHGRGFHTWRRLAACLPVCLSFCALSCRANTSILPLVSLPSFFD